MAQTRFHTLLEAKVKTEIVGKTTSLAEGSAKDYGEYKYWVGYVAGLMASLEIANEIMREAEGYERSGSA